MGIKTALLVVAALAAVMTSAAPAAAPTNSCKPQLTFQSANNRCNWQGYVKVPQSISTCTASSARACRDECFATGSCVSYAFDRSGTQACHLYFEKVDMQAPVAANTGVFFWDRDCWYVPC